MKSCVRGWGKLVTALRTCAFSPKRYMENNRKRDLKCRGKPPFHTKISWQQAWALFQSTHRSLFICHPGKSEWDPTGSQPSWEMFPLPLQEAAQSPTVTKCRSQDSSPPLSNPSPVLFQFLTFSLERWGGRLSEAALITQPLHSLLTIITPFELFQSSRGLIIYIDV